MKQRRAKPLNLFACRLKPSENPGVQARKTHPGKCVVSLRNAVKYLASVIAEATTHRANVVSKFLVTSQLAAQRASKDQLLCEQLRDGGEVACIPNALIESCNE